MGHLNILKGAFTGKVGQVVGAKWKNKNTIRVYSKPAYTNTPPQQIIRTGFAEISSYVALFADQIKPFSALNTKGMTVRNAIIKLNRDMLVDGSLLISDLLISRGGLPNIRYNDYDEISPTEGFKITWTPSSAATISDRALVVGVAVIPDHYIAAVNSAPNTAGEMIINCQLPSNAKVHIHYYLIDYRGSSKVASMSGYDTFNAS